MANDDPIMLECEASDTREQLAESVPFAARDPGSSAGWIVPAWLLSLVCHLAAFLVAVIVVRPAASLPSNEPDRAAAIVVARATDRQATAYLQEDSFAADDRATAAAEAMKSTQDMPFSASSAAPLVAGIELPKTVSLAGAEAGVALATSLGGGRSSRAKLERDGEGPVGEVADLGPPEPAGSPVKLSIFGSAMAEGRSFVFVIDHSKSMGGSGLDVLHAAERQLTAALSRLAPEHRFQIIAYNETPTFLGRRKLLDATDENKRSLQRFFADLVAVGATEHERALHAALALRPDVIFLLTDGGDPELTNGQLHEIRTHAAGRTAIHCVQFGFGPLPEAEPFLQRLATQNGGQFRYLDVTQK